MSRRFGSLLIVSASLLSIIAAAPVAAADRENQAQAVDQCNNRNNKFIPHLQINGCTLIIKYSYGDTSNIAAAFFGRGKAYLKLKNYKQAIKEFTEAENYLIKAKASQSQLSELQTNIGIAYAELNMHDQAITAYNKALALDGRNFFANYNRSISYFWLKQPDLQMADLDQAIALNPDFKSALNVRAAMLVRAGKYNEAKADYTKSIKIDPNQAQQYVERGAINEALGEFEQAYSDFSEAIKLRRDDSNLYNARCYLAFEANSRLDTALGDCNRSIMLSKSAMNLDSRGAVYLRLQRWQEAWADFDEAIRLERYPSALFGRGLAAKGLQRSAEATADIAEALKLDPKIGEHYAKFGVKP